MTLREKRQALLTRLLSVNNPRDRLSKIVEDAKRIPPLPAELKTAVNLIPGCLSRLWFVAEVRENICFFQCDSDSAIVKAVALLLCDFYSGHPPAEILEIDPSFLREVGLTQHLSANRRNGLARLWEKILTVARANAHPDETLRRA